jgi:hypothetical protein
MPRLAASSVNGVKSPRCFAGLAQASAATGKTPANETRRPRMLNRSGTAVLSRSTINDFFSSPRLILPQ